MGLRDAVKAMSPSWLQDGVAEKYLYDIGLCADALLDKMNQAARLHLPGYGDESALPLIGADRLISRGLGESAASYAQRLKGWLDAWRTAGSAASVLRQLSALLASLTSPGDITPGYETVTDGGAWDVYPPGAGTDLPPAHYLVTPPNWNWDGLAQVWRFWLVITSAGAVVDAFNPGPVFGAPGVVIGDPTISIGLDKPASVIAAIRSIAAQWKASGAWCRWIVISFDDSLFDPSQSADGVHNPAGTFGRWSKIVSSQYVPSRFANARYCDGAI